MYKMKLLKGRHVVKEAKIQAENYATARLLFALKLKFETGVTSDLKEFTIGGEKEFKSYAK